jgi:hypothetical protein
MAATAKFGAALGSDELTKSVETDKQAEEIAWRNKSGVEVKHHTFNPTTAFSVVIEGDARADFDVGVDETLPLTGLTGGSSVITGVKYSESYDGKAETAITGKHRPSASALA